MSECDAAMQNMEYSNSFELSASASQFDIKGFGQNEKQLYSRHTRLRLENLQNGIRRTSTEIYNL